MPKVDVTKIEGYADMSAEDKIKELEAYETDAPDYTGYIRKETFDKTASELAGLKRQLKEKMSDEEVAKQKEQEERAELQKKYEQLLRETSISKNKAKFLAMGYDEKLADDTAEAIVSGDMDRVFNNQKSHLDNFEKKIRAEALKQTPKPIPDGSSKTMTLEKLRGMSVEERLTYSTSHPEEYKELYGGN